MKYIVIISAAVYALQFIGVNLAPWLYFDSNLILHGQIWRLISFIFIVPNTSIIFAAFVFYFYYIIGATLEQEWGSFVFTAYYFTTVFICVALGMLTGGSIVNSYYINLAMFLAYGFSYPENQVMLFMIIPVKMKYLAWAYVAFEVLWIITGTGLAGRLIPLCGLISFVLFFWKDLLSYIRKPGYKPKPSNIHKKSNVKKANLHAVHRCEVCGRTEVDDPDLQFRFCTRCHGFHEYCMEHLYTHEHK